MSNFHVRSGNGSIHHYHIRWSTKEVLDWEAFESRGDAKSRAELLLRSGETYTIEEHNAACPRCWNTSRLKASHEPEARKYPWQQAVADAFHSPRESLPLKFLAAQRAVSARLCDRTPADLHEQIAIRDALHSLSALLLELSPKQSSEHKLKCDGKEQTA